MVLNACALVTFGLWLLWEHAHQSTVGVQALSSRLLDMNPTALCDHFSHCNSLPTSGPKDHGLQLPKQRRSSQLFVRVTESLLLSILQAEEKGWYIHVRTNS